MFSTKIMTIASSKNYSHLLYSLQTGSLQISINKLQIMEHNLPNSSRSIGKREVKNGNKELDKKWKEK